MAVPLSPDALLNFNVGGRRFTTTRPTVFSRGANFLTALVKNDEEGKIPCTRDCKGFIFIDRSPDGFSMILDFLRSGQVYKPPGWTEEQIATEFDFYGVESALTGAGIAAEQAEVWGVVEEHRVAWKKQAEQWVDQNRGALVSALLEEMRRGQYKSDVSSIAPSFELTFNYDAGTRTGPPQLRLQGGKDIRIEDSAARNPLWLYHAASRLSRESHADVAIEKGGCSLRIKFGWQSMHHVASVQDIFELLESCRTSRDARYAWEAHTSQNQLP